MSNGKQFNADEWLSRCDIASIPEINDKVKECEFFFNALSAESNRNNFRWLTSAFLNAAYSFFESTALTAHFRYSDPETGEPYEDHEGLAVLRSHVKVSQRASNPSFVDTSGLTSLTKQLYEFRKKNTHHFSLAIMATGPNLPEDFHFGSMRDEGVPVMPLCREVLALIKDIHAEINE